jgi:putative transposase
MPRLARLDTPGLLHHSMIRGIERRRIFNGNEDRENLIERLSKLLPKTKTQCYAWVCTPNHTHFLFRSGPSVIREKNRKGRGSPTGINEILDFRVAPHC